MKHALTHHFSLQAFRIVKHLAPLGTGFSLLLALSAFQPFSPSALSAAASVSASPASTGGTTQVPAAGAAAPTVNRKPQTVNSSAPASDINLPGIPTLPVIIPHYDAKAYAWVWDGAGAASAWRLLPRNEARILHKIGSNIGQQLVGTLTIDGCYDVPAVPGWNVTLLFRAKGDFKTYKGLPARETGIEVVKLDVQPGPRKNQLIRTAQLQRQGEASATFGARREPIIVHKIERTDGVFHSVQVARPLSPGRYALYLPDRAFEFEVK